MAEPGPGSHLWPTRMLVEYTSWNDDGTSYVERHWHVTREAAGARGSRMDRAS